LGSVYQMSQDADTGDVVVSASTGYVERRGVVSVSQRVI